MACKIYEFYYKLNYALADPRTKDMLLISSPFKISIIVGLYLWFCIKAGPHFMKNRKPFQLKKTLIIYNLCQMLISLSFFIAGIPYWFFKFSWKCEPIDYSYSPDALLLTRIAYVYFLSKLVELLDTVFFVLRKKFSQVSTLHLYHHASMVIITWVGVKYFTGGQSTFFAFINSFVHIVMYFYYFLTSLGPEYRKHLTWKKQLTILQIVQFVIVVIHNLQTLPRDCDYPKTLSIVFVVLAGSFLYMFASFYVQAYVKPKQKRDV